MNWHRQLMRLCGGIAATLIAVVTILVCYDVLARNLGLGSVPWIVDVTEYAMPIITLAAAPWLMSRNEHVRLDVLNMVLSPRAQRVTDRVAALVGLVVSIVLVWYGWQALEDSRRSGDMVIKALVFAEWWVYVPVPIGFALLALECARRLLRPGTADTDTQGRGAGA